MIDGSVLQSAQRCFEKKSRVVVKMVVIFSSTIIIKTLPDRAKLLLTSDEYDDMIMTYPAASMPIGAGNNVSFVTSGTTVTW